MEIPHGNLSVYIPKKSRNFISICMEYSRQELDESKFSPFVLMCMSEFINNLSPTQKIRFETIAQEMAEKDKPRSTAFVKQFMGNYGGDQNGD